MAIAEQHRSVDFNPIHQAKESDDAFTSVLGEAISGLLTHYWHRNPRAFQIADDRMVLLDENGLTHHLKSALASKYPTQAEEETNYFLRGIEAFAIEVATGDKPVPKFRYSAVLKLANLGTITQ